MSDEITRKPRSAINALKVINSLRAEKGLPKLGAKPAKVRLPREAKEALFRQVVQEFFPEALTAANFDFTERNQKIALSEFEKRLKEIQGESVPYTGKPRGRKPKV